ncbi:MAG: hypothetical protein ACR2H0_01640 [Candidatus Limnocylindrales bacterium]
MKRLIWLPVAGFLLVAGATVAAAAPSLADTAQSLLNLQAPGVSASGSPAPPDGSGATGVRALEVGGEGSVLSDVLAELVTAGTITQAQSDAIVEALTTKADERRAEFEAQCAEMEAMFTQIKGFLEDGVISADEIAQLPADNPFTNLTDILADGQITQDELESIGPFGGGHFFGGPHRGHHGPGDHGLWSGPDTDNETNDDATDATASPNANG